MTASITFTVTQAAGVVGILGGLMLYSEHKKGARQSTKGNHEKLQARKAKDQEGFIKKSKRKIIKSEMD